MSSPKPSTSLVWQAIEVYLKCAYGEAKLPSAVRERLDTLQACRDAQLFDCPVFERDPGRGRLLLRLGSRFYPHMKLVIERAPDAGGYLFRADTHDHHIRPPPGSREYRTFRDLMQTNRAIAAEIETEWAHRGVPTFKQYLRRDLERRFSAEPSACQQQPPAP